MPSAYPPGSEYWKYQATSGWFQIPIGSDDGDNTITIELTDGGIGDANGLVNGVISDPGGLGIQSPFVVPEYAFGGLLALFACLAAFILFKTRKNFPRNKQLMR